MMSANSIVAVNKVLLFRPVFVLQSIGKLMPATDGRIRAPAINRLDLGCIRLILRRISRSVLSPGSDYLSLSHGWDECRPSHTA
jgi:hypothetical protein